ncbi:MAG: hypothetical protein AAFP77_28405 [Bacteroidota bacterium]
MKRIIIVASLILLASSAQTQPMDSTIVKMLEQGLIAEDQTKEFTDLDTGKLQSAAGPYLYLLIRLENIRMFGEPEPNYAQFLTTQPLEEEDWEVVKGNLLDHLQRLDRCGLVNERLMPMIAGQIEQRGIKFKLSLLLFTLQLVEQDARLAPASLEGFCNGLQEHAICTGENLTRLNEAINQRKIDNPIDFLNYCDRSRLFELANYSEDPTEYIEQIHRETSALLEDLTFEDFKHEIQISESKFGGNHKSYRLAVSLRCNGRVYKQKSFYLPPEERNKPLGLSYFGKIGTQGYYKIFNKILADNQSPYRLHLVTSSVNNVADYSKYAIIALTEPQADYLHKGRSKFRPSYEDFKSNVTSSRIEEAIAAYEKLGLLDHLTAEQIAKGKETVMSREHWGLGTVLGSFPNVVLTFDMELGNLSDPYAELVGWYAEISRGNFTPTNITDDFDLEKNQFCNLAFDFNGKHYTKRLRIESDWIDTDFFEFMNEVAKESGLPGSFHFLATGGQDASIVFLTEEQHAYLTENALME